MTDRRKERLRIHHRILLWLFPVDRVWYSYCEPDLIERRFQERGLL